MACDDNVDGDEDDDDDADDDKKSDGLWIGHYAQLPRPAFALFSLTDNPSS